MTIEHVAMLAAMAGVMLLRPAEYARHDARRARVELRLRRFRAQRA
jgi:hypothetical protein